MNEGYFAGIGPVILGVVVWGQAVAVDRICYSTPSADICEHGRTPAMIVPDEAPITPNNPMPFGLVRPLTASSTTTVSGGGYDVVVAPRS